MNTYAEKSRRTGLRLPSVTGAISRRGESMYQLKRNVLSVALASATLMLATSAWAQEQQAQQTQEPQETQQAQTPDTREKQEEAQAREQAQQLETVQVVGIRVGIEDAIETKKNSISIVESVS